MPQSPFAPRFFAPLGQTGQSGQLPAPGYMSDLRVPLGIRDQAQAAMQAQQQLQSVGPHSSDAVSALQGFGSYLAGRQEGDARQQAAPYTPGSAQPWPSLLGSLLRGQGSGAQQAPSRRTRSIRPTAA